MYSSAATPRTALPTTVRARQVRRRVRVTACAEPAALLPELETVLRLHVCPAIAECAGLNIGDAARQQDVLDAFWAYTHAFELGHGGHEHVLRALLAGDAWNARQLAVSFDLYNASLDLIHAALDGVEARAH